jgi:hypothetical protein
VRTALSGRLYGQLGVVEDRGSLTVDGLRWTVDGLRLTAYGGRLTVDGLRLTAYG